MWATTTSKGFEFQVNWDAATKDFSYSTNLNLVYKSKLKSFSNVMHQLGYMKVMDSLSPGNPGSAQLAQKTESR